MNNLKRTIKEFDKELKKALADIDFVRKLEELSKLTDAAKASDLWSDPSNAQAIMQKQSKLTAQIEPWQSLKSQLKELEELISMDDASLSDDLDKQVNSARERLVSLKKELQFGGKYDDHNALVSIHAGAGGTDAQDWAQILLRMYVRWAEQNNMKVKILNESAGEEAGIKSAELEISGTFVFGKLSGEHGVHRLVRLSPFNANNLRQTSFAKIEILPKIDEPNEVPLEDNDLKIDVFRAGGHGGQSVNTTDSAVRITHLPTNVVVSIQNERSQLQNKETALGILRSRLAQLQVQQHQETLTDLKGPNQSAEWGNQIRSYVLHPYTMVKDLRTRHETSNAQAVLDGDLNPFIEAYLSENLK